MKKINKQISKIGFSLLIIFGFSNFMWLGHGKPRWPGNLTTMTERTYRINSNFRAMPGNNFLTADDARQAIQESANIWRDQGFANFRFNFIGNSDRNRVAGLPANIPIDRYCEFSEQVQRFRDLDKVVFAQADIRNGNNLVDGDLPTPAPHAGRVLAQNWTWACNGEYLHFDIRFNDRDQIWTRQEIHEVAIHELGHSLGLSHCGTNETTQQCAANRPGTDPTTGMMMNKFYITGTNKLHLDDIAGIRALYGVRNAAPFAGNLIAIKKSATGTNSTEVHILDGASNFSTFSLHAVTPIEENTSNFEFIPTSYPVRGGSALNIIAIKKFNTGSLSTEIHVLNGATDFGTFILETATILAETGSNFDMDFWL